MTRRAPCSRTHRRGPRRGLAVVACLTVALTGAAPMAATAASVDKRDLFGWLERVELGKSRLEMEAKLDTGADVSSLHTERIRHFRRNGRRWVEFRVRDAESGRVVRFRKRVLRTARIKQHEGGPQRRSVIELELCLGEHMRRIEINLTDRSEFTTPVLLGREALEGIAVVDPAETFTSLPDCPPEEEAG